MEPGDDAIRASSGVDIAISIAIFGVSLVESGRDAVDDSADQPLDGRGLGVGVVAGDLVAAGHVGVERCDLTLFIQR